MEYKLVKAHAIKILEKVIEAIEKDDLKKLDSMIDFSPAGDDMGYDNYYIKFGKQSHKNSLDIGDILEILKEKSNDK